MTLTEQNSALFSARDAQKMAYEKDLDLVKIAPNANRRFAEFSIMENSALNRLRRKRKQEKIRELLISRK